MVLPGAAVVYPVYPPKRPYISSDALIRTRYSCFTQVATATSVSLSLLPPPQDPNRGWYSPPDGMDGTAADLVMLVTPPGKYCGIAWIGGRTSVVGIDCFRSLSFAHELGHNFGGYHNREEHPGNTHPYAYAPW